MKKQKTKELKSEAMKYGKERTLEDDEGEGIKPSEPGNTQQRLNLSSNETAVVDSQIFSDRMHTIDV